MPDDPDPIPVGATGRIVDPYYDEHGLEAGILHVQWDPPNEHRSLNVIVGIDLFEFIIDDPEVQDA